MKILVIDDDPAMTDLLRLILSPIQAAIFTSNSGPEGVEIAASENPDIIILDLMMPEMDGWEVCRIVRESSNVPILIMSAIDNPGLIAKALDAGADDFLVKPVPSGVLIAHIMNLTRPRSLSSQQLSQRQMAFNHIVK
ncbi:MAG: response regulator [Anaerolineaceae bacterium]